ncbi:MAG: hypothetical protein JO044_20410 [Mycobacteriaceae bacterium]|nr:hypothetical protein [Mycobacteriaceae bacterium]MBV9639395.1 hypothetical protein [Mycobacteriaceae bacterium]
MKIMAVVVLGCGLLAAPVIGAGPASGEPSSCDGAGCVPYVAQNVTAGAQCSARTRYDFGLDSSGATLICASVGKWAPTRALTGVRPLGAPCYGSAGSAQSPDGLPMTCNGWGWTGNYPDMYAATAA